VSGAALPPLAPRLAAVVVGLGASVAPLDFAVNIAFPAITAAFGLETRAIRWVAVCYVLSYGSLMMAFGAVGDRIGHLRVFRAGLALGALAFTLGALAPAFPLLLGARVLQGVAVALILSCAPALVTLAYAERDRTRALSAYAAGAAIASVIAPVAGGLAMQATGWSGVYWMRVPVVLAALALTPRLRLRPAVMTSEPLDRRAMALLAAALAAWLLAPALLGTGGAWTVVAAGAAGALLTLAFVRGQRGAVRPLIPGPVARDPGFWLPNVAHTLVQFASFAVPLLVPYHLMLLARWSAPAAGLLLSTWALGTLAGATWAPRLMAARGGAFAARLASSASALGLAAIAAWPSDAPVALMAACLALQGLGLGLYQVVCTDLVVATLPESSRGVAGSLAMVTRTVGVVLGASCWTALLAAGARDGLQDFSRGFAWAMAGATLTAALTVLIPGGARSSSPSIRR
jgi:MFS family permease